MGPDGCLLDPLQSLQDAGGIWADEIGFANMLLLLITEIGGAPSFTSPGG